MARSNGAYVVATAVVLLFAGCNRRGIEPADQQTSALKGPVAAATGICPPTVTIGGCDSGVAATVGGQCIQLAVDACLTAGDKHGDFVSCVSDAIKDLVS